MNQDPVTGIRYGIIPANGVPYLWDYLTPYYGEPTCPRCGGNAVDYDDDHETYTQITRCPDYACTYCEISFSSDQAYPDEPCHYVLDAPDYTGFVDETGDLWITHSPYTAHAGLCSPCAPGAVYLTTPGSYQAYCLGPEWWEDSPCPYEID